MRKTTLETLMLCQRSIAGSAIRGEFVRLALEDAGAPDEIIKHLRNTYPQDFQWKQPPYEYERKRLPIEILIGGPIESVFGD